MGRQIPHRIQQPDRELDIVRLRIDRKTPRALAANDSIRVRPEAGTPNPPAY